jgi:hypothetical protein
MKKVEPCRRGHSHFNPLSRRTMESIGMPTSAPKQRYLLSQKSQSNDYLIKNLVNLMPHPQKRRN